MLNKLRDKLGFLLLSKETRNRVQEGLEYYKKAMELQEIFHNTLKQQMEESMEDKYPTPRILQ